MPARRVTQSLASASRAADDQDAAADRTLEGEVCPVLTARSSSAGPCIARSILLAVTTLRPLSIARATYPRARDERRPSPRRIRRSSRPPGRRPDSRVTRARSSSRHAVLHRDRARARARPRRRRAHGLRDVFGVRAQEGLRRPQNGAAAEQSQSYRGHDRHAVYTTAEATRSRANYGQPVPHLPRVRSPGFGRRRRSTAHRPASMLTTVQTAGVAAEPSWLQSAAP